MSDGKATFTAKVTSSTIYYAHADDTFTWTVYDNGEGSTEPATISPSTARCLVAATTPARPHAVPHHGGQHPGPLQQLIQPRTNALDRGGLRASSALVVLVLRPGQQREVEERRPQGPVR